MNYRIKFFVVLFFSAFLFGVGSCLVSPDDSGPGEVFCECDSFDCFCVDRAAGDGRGAPRRAAADRV